MDSYISKILKLGYIVGYQTNGLVPYNLLPTIPFKKQVKKKLDKYEISNTSTLLNNIENVIEELSIYYSVKKDTVKTRMIDIGYPEAASAFSYINGNHIRPFVYTKCDIDEKKYIQLKHVN